jgi:uncharacterized protein (DUF1778 family)
MGSILNALTGKVSVTVQLDKGLYNFLKDTNALNGRTVNDFIADAMRFEAHAMIGDLSKEWFDREAIMKKYGLEEPVQAKA